MSLATVNIPVVETERLLLRANRESDFEAYLAFDASERSHWVGGPIDRWTSWRKFLSTLGHWALHGYGLWTVEIKDTGAVAGRVGFNNHDGWLEPEIGWSIFDGFEGQGIAREAAEAALAYGARHFGIDGPISYIHPDNTRSAALAERLGAHREREVEFFNAPCVVWRHPRRTEAAA
ncbi:GNAT family N-acetyltransferase [Vannielia litorea]|uniref:GNAT family N-acetyltransferase n=1 Tax=Vannielia TaxID=2813041 RepID=UPI001C95A511|nr:GNAT family N-acetyltransferase [Vannielia litorea]MBY6046090.1 GNAT family N-acetyltransferase [Vannielia litorea]MBY6073503.1 GNAT family N-acetyltransferase [Vannielia litorea]MBY6154049.1 GNAT family N-acetyltransferase [Vannielia litorea]